MPLPNLISTCYLLPLPPSLPPHLPTLPFLISLPSLISFPPSSLPSLLFLPHLSLHFSSSSHHLSSLPFSPFFSGGTFEDLVVTYSIQQLNLAALATSDGTSPLAYFSVPVANTTLTGSLLRSVNTTALGQCAWACLSDETCLSFSQLPSLCQLYLATLAAGSPNVLPGASYYEKNQTKVGRKL